jgi:putative DNA primase/helicase
MRMTATTADHAARLIQRFEMKLVPLTGKTPNGGFGWNTDANLIGTVEAARTHWSENPDHNVGVCLEPSGLVSLDADNEEETRRALAPEGIDLDALIARTPTILGRAPRLEFSAPAGIKLTRKSFVLPPKESGGKPITVVELRGGRLQDVFPPSIHPDTGRPYTWLNPPRDGFPPLPDSLLNLWQNFDAFKRRARKLCTWADPEPEPTPPRPRPFRARTRSVISEFNDAHSAEAILEAAGYQREGKRRFKSPDGHGVAGVVVLPNGKVFSHHQSDRLCGDHAHDAFDVFRILQHRGDYRAAVRAAAEALGMDRKQA